MEGLKLDVLALVPEQVHHELEVILACNVSSHDGKICPIQQYFS